VSRLLGIKRIEGVELANIDTGATEVVDCDSVIFTGDWIPEHDLARSAGLAMDAGTLGPAADAEYRTSAPGVFAAGNLLHGAETAEVSALEGRQAAQHIAAYLRAGAQGWPERRLPLHVAAPVEWVYPNHLTATDTRLPFGHFKFRAQAFTRNARLAVTQGERVLHTQSYGELRPNASQPLAADWLAHVDLSGPPLRLAPAA
jgi:hypothetical protein